MELLRGDAALAALDRALGAAEGLVGIDVDPRARDGHPVQLVAVADARHHEVLIDARGTPGLGARLGQKQPLCAYDAKVVHRALRGLAGFGLDRWACVRLSELLIAGGRDQKLELEAIAERLHLPAPPPADHGFEALTARARTAAVVIAQQIADIKADELGWVSKLEAAAVAPVAEMEEHGMAVDAPLWRSLNGKAEAEREELRRVVSGHFRSVAGSTLFGESALNLDNDADLRRALHALGHQVPNVRRTTLAEIPPPLGPPLTRYRELSKIVTAYGESFLEHVQADGRVHPTFDQIGASTGRMACHAPNLQAVVKDSGFRKCFRAPPGRTLVIADYATCELRILAEMSGDPVFRDAFARGHDLHATVASSMFGVPVSKTENPELRQRAKAVNFGLVYGMGAAGLARAIDTELPQAEKLLARYFDTFPAIGAFLEDSARQALRRGWCRTLCGRRLYLQSSSDRSERAAAERVAKNMPIQGTSADIIKIALARIRTALRPWPTAALVNAVHDEIVVECTEADAPAVRTAVAEQMEAAGAEVLKEVRLQADAEISTVWE